MLLISSLFSLQGFFSFCLSHASTTLKLNPQILRDSQKNKAERPEASRKVIGELIIIPEADKK